MNELLDLVFVQGDILQSFCRLFILGFSLDMILNFAHLIGDSKS